MQVVSMGAGCCEVDQFGNCVDALHHYDSGAAMCIYGF